MQNLNIAIVGCGRIGFKLESDPLRYKPCTHFGGAISNNLKITHACDINKKRLMEFSKIAKLSDDRLFTDYKELFKNNNIDIAIIASWTNSHAPIAIEASNNGAKVIICEKPISSNIFDAKMMLDVCNKNNTKIIINHERRYEYRYNYIKKLIESNYIGKITGVYGFVFTQSINSNNESGGGVLLHDGTHLIDIIRYIFGDIKSVKGKIEKYSNKSKYEDYAFATLTTKDNLNIVIEAGNNRKYFLFELQIFGLDGKIVIGNGYYYIYKPKKSKLYTNFCDLSPVKLKIKGKPDYFKRIYKEAVNAYNNDKINIISSGIDGYKALEIIHSIYYSAFNNSIDVQLPLNITDFNIEKLFKNFK